MEHKEIKAPFTEDQAKVLNEYQVAGMMHPFTCCSHDGCKRDESVNHGVLIASKNGWICPCGKYKQDWAHSFMADKSFVERRKQFKPMSMKQSKRMKSEIKKLNGTGKNQARFMKQAKRWFGKNPNRKVIIMETDSGEKLITREQLIK